MRFFENIAKQIFRDGGIPILEGHVAYSPEEAMSISSDMGFPVVIKAQVLTGGRGKAGGVKFAKNPGEAFKIANEILGMEIKGETVKHLLIEEKADILHEFFVTVSVDRGARRPVIIVSKEGGVEIENLAKTNPEKLIKYYPNPLIEFLPYEAREIARKMDVPSDLISPLGDIIWKLYNVFTTYDCDTAEINPLVLTPNGLIAADAKLVVENDSLFRHQDLVERLRYKQKTVDFVKLDGDIAVIGNGAGLTLTAMDMIKLNGGEPATFLDIGGGASEQIINKALNIVLNYDPVKVVFLNVLGGITKADDVARGVINVLNEVEREVPIVIRLTGTNEEEGHKLLEEAGIPYETSMEKAAKKAVELCNELK
ncbi:MULTISPECIES: ADP-forming succinate--CoA ligase subunit beta [Methanobrevibacter]|uniref:ADP-forming succinate--CoA ligase subunit beta n=1 Tax=Methanobrevibacter TaxID=2172 RepID=UPI002600DFD4|nr:MULTISPECIES: ADP-forming succinate--CoA ligase subunit beta [Methanobrevibacter]MBS7258552.1 ADP-forming succinate--CoA ligase subunit beta [Methanobrevibacter sp.]MCI7429243.1 ADP-forming succinate--CoA ligase subunit beta [Methanobrevibacter sp.]MDD6776178.1 ADP-forming succinate--CoA ligase subunit beta [Methanobacteriaceae archaeon]MDY3096380.1 ADP-forming succinate--CoA ligase subunit beta [Methanobrevibacter sp.]